MQKGIGIGIEDFREVIKEDCYYFDKTNYIEELIKDKTKIKLFPLCTTKNSSIGWKPPLSSFPIFIFLDFAPFAGCSVKNIWNGTVDFPLISASFV